MLDYRKDYRGNNQTTKVYDLQVDNDLTLTGDTDLTGALDLTGDLTVVGDTDLTGALDLTGLLTVVGDTDLTGALDLTGKLDITGDLDASGALDIAGAISAGGLIDAEAGLKVLAGSQYTTTGGNATEVASIASKGIEAGDLVIASIEDDGAGDEVLLTAKVTANNEITFVFASDPSSDTVVNYIVLKP